MKNSDRRDVNVMEILQTKLEHLPPSHKGLARFLLTNFDEAVFLTAAQLANRSHTSEASVTRFAKRLGYRGYPELQEDLQTILRQNLPPKERMQRAGGVPSSSKAVVERSTEMAILNIRETHKALDHQLLHEAAKRIAAAQTKYMVGLRSSASAAQLLGFQLGLILRDVRVQAEGGPHLFEGLLSVSKRDVVVAISFPRYSKWTAEALRYAKEQGAATIAITDSPLSPIGQVADIALAARVSSRTFAVSYVAAMLVIDCLIGMVASLKPRESLARLDALERVLKGHDFFYEARG
jgi:DNA-binding MurR/RpiR family transcriptional regulator